MSKLEADILWIFFGVFIFFAIISLLIKENQKRKISSELEVKKQEELNKDHIIQELRQRQNNEKLEIEIQKLKDKLDKSLEGSNEEIIKEVKKLKSELSEFQKK